MIRYFTVGLVLLAIGLVHSAAAQDQTRTLSAIQSMLNDGRQQEALLALDERIDADINDVQSRFLKGLILVETGDDEGARRVFTNIARLFPQLPEAYNNLAALYVKAGDYEKARRALNSAKANAPDYATVHNNLGDLYLKMALDAYRTALELDDSDEAAAAKRKMLESMFSAPES